MACCKPLTSVFQEAVLISLEHMSYVELVRLSACSKLMRDTIATVLSSGDRGFARGLLRSVLEDAGATGDAARPRNGQRYQAVVWLLRTADIPPGILALDNYLDVPQVPPAICARLLAAGTTVTDDLVISAARQGVQGVGNWVQEACRRSSVRGMPIGATGLHPCVEWLFCPLSCRTMEQHQYRDTLLNLEANTAEDLLYVVINSLPGGDPGDDPAGHVPRGILVYELLQVSPAVQQISAQSCTHLLHFMIELEAKRGSLASWTACAFMFPRLFKVPGMQQMTAAAAYNVVSTAMRRRNNKAPIELDVSLLHFIVKAPGVARLTAGNIATLLTTALQSTKEQRMSLRQLHALVRALCRAPAASEIPCLKCEQLLDMLLDLHQHGNLDGIRYLLGEAATRLIMLPGMQQLNAIAINRLLGSVLHIASGPGGDWTTCVLKSLCRLPVAQQVLTTLQEPHARQQPPAAHQ